MTNVKVTLRGKNGKEFEALVPITTACKVLIMGEDTSNISRMSYSVVHKCHNFLLDGARSAGISTDELEDAKVKVLFALMERTNNFLMTNGVWLYRD